MLTSQNGWPVIAPDVADARTRLWVIPGCPDMRLLPGPAGFVLAHWIMWYDRNVEDVLAVVDDHGWGYRQIGGSDEWSNHSSATAVDLNAVKHPQGVRDTFTAEQQAIILDALERRYRNVIKAGMTFRTTADDMHYELVAGRTAVRELAADLYDTRIGKRLREANPEFLWTPAGVEA